MTKKSSKEIILSLLKKYKKVTLRKMFDYKVGYSCVKRIYDLRQEGYKIETYRHRPELKETASDNGYILMRGLIQ